MEKWCFWNVHKECGHERLRKLVNHLPGSSSLETDEVVSLAKVICLLCFLHVPDKRWTWHYQQSTLHLCLLTSSQAVLKIWRVMMSTENVNVSHMVVYHLFSPCFCRHREDTAMTGGSMGWAHCVPSHWASITCSTERECRGKEEAHSHMSYIHWLSVTHTSSTGVEMTHCHCLSLPERIKWKAQNKFTITFLNHKNHYNKSP